MKKLFIIAAVSILIFWVAILSCTNPEQENAQKSTGLHPVTVPPLYPNVTQSIPPEQIDDSRKKPLLPPPVTVPPAPVPSIPPEQKALKVKLVDDKDLVELGLSMPRQLSSQEENDIKQIALNTEMISQTAKEGTPFRIDEVAWMAYIIPNSTWSFFRLKENQTYQPNPDFAYFAAVKIGLGSPQMYQVNVAVDAVGQKAVYAVRTYDRHSALPLYLKSLSDKEKQQLIDIASETPVCKTMGTIEKTEFHWLAISSSGGTICNLDNDIMEKGIPDNIPLQEKAMTIYPAVTIITNTICADITIDLKTGKTMDVFVFQKR
jgi:hypothetical protein